MLIQLVHVPQLQSFMGPWEGRAGKMASGWGTLRPRGPSSQPESVQPPLPLWSQTKMGSPIHAAHITSPLAFLTSIPTLQWEHNSLYQVRIKGGEIRQVLKLRTKSVTICLIPHFFSDSGSPPPQNTSPNSTFCVSGGIGRENNNTFYLYSLQTAS